jgi:hypothetical protein
VPRGAFCAEAVPKRERAKKTEREYKSPETARKGET